MPAISRPLLIALIAAVVALVGFYATQGARNASDSSEVAAPAPVPAPAPTADKAEQEPTAVAKVDNADAAQPDRAKRDGQAEDASNPRTDKADKADAKAAKAERAKVDRAARDAAAAKAAARLRARTERLGMPPAVARAIDGRKTVVLFFRGSGSADDRATERAVAGLRGERGVVVFSDRIGRLGRYPAVVGDLGISQAPAIVIVDRGRSARVLQGYVDPATLAQDVADSR